MSSERYADLEDGTRDLACPAGRSRGTIPKVKLRAPILRFLRLFSATVLATVVVGANAHAATLPPLTNAWIWPLGGTTTPDEMNTPFGPRTDSARWDFHDGVDLPAPIGTTALAVANATVHREGAGGTDGISSRHVVLRIDDPTGGVIYAYYLHLSAIDPAIFEGGNVTKGQPVGAVGDDDATYSHLHFETRHGASTQVSSVHPLHYLPYPDTSNFSAPIADRFNRIGANMAARIRFGAADRHEGDLIGAEVDLMNGATLLETRRVDFDLKTTTQEGNGDSFEWTGDIAVEGYQRSNMSGDGRLDLQYGLLVRELPAACDTLVARAIDLGGHTMASAPIAVPAQVEEVRHLDFEDGALPPAAWTIRTSSTGTGTTLANSAAAAWSGSRGLLAVDSSTSESSTQTASIETPIPAGRFQWVAEGRFEPNSFALDFSDSFTLLQFQSGTVLGAAAVVRNNSGAAQAGIFIRNPDSTVGSTFSTSVVAPAAWRRWTLDLLHVGTRETTAVLYLDGAEVARRNWDGTTYEPTAFRAGVGQISKTATINLAADEVRLGEGGRLALPTFAPGRVPDGLSAGTPLSLAKAGASVALAWGVSCNTGGTDYVVLEGALGSFTSHQPRLCSTGGLTSSTILPTAGDRYFLVAPRSDDYEGSPGLDGAGVEIPPAANPCRPQLPGGC